MSGSSEQQSAHPRSFRAHVRYHCAAKAYRPPVRAIREKYPFQRVRCATTLRNPMQATIIRIEYCASGAHGPPLQRVEKLDIKQISFNAGILSLPGAPAIYGLVDTAAAPDRPPQAVANKRAGRETDGALTGVSQA